MTFVLALFIAVSTHSSGPGAKPAVDSLAEGFRNPPPSARPHTWWHWMDGNVTKEGLTADLEAMKQAGIGGAQMFTVAQGIPKGPVDYMSPQWREMTKHAVKEAGRLGIELCIHNCAGWSSSGGPWVMPENAMQVLAWSEVKVQGPTVFDAMLPQPKAPQVYAKVDFYRDIAVFAYPTQDSDGAQKPDPNLLGKSGVVRQDGLDPELDRVSSNPIASNRMVDLTDKLDSNGRLTWNAPAGTWTILRLGHVPTGKDNHPAPPEGDGLEVDKLSREALDQFWSGTMATVIKDVGPLAGTVLNNALVDSYEVGSQNWTPQMREEFRKRRGYDPMPWLPAITGLVVESNEKTERFLWDWRRTIADLYADNYYGYFGELCHKAGLKFSTEPYGNGGFDNIQAGGKADIPMGEFWIGGGTLETTKIASSVGHVYGLPVIGAESFTADEGRGKWLEEPYTAKALGDLVFCNGINRYIFHRYAHQPWMNLKPGMTMGPWGTHLERTQTWWTEAATWLKYVARCQYLLQKGLFVADALYYYGEGAPVDLPYRPGLKPAMPAGYDYDGIDTSLLLKARVVNRRVTLPSGMSYAVLCLPNSQFMTPEVATKLRTLVDSGATVVGTKPTQSPSLVGYPECDQKVKNFGNELWGLTNGKDLTLHRYGSGRVFWGASLSQIFTSSALKPDFEFKSLTGGSKLVYIHRKIDSADAYFVSNQNYRPTEVDCTFRVSGKAPELWHADTGMIEPAPVYREVDGRTVVQLRLDPAESVFVIFRRPSIKDHLASFDVKGKRIEVLRPSKIEIKSARYESADGRGADVTQIVAQLVNEGQTEIAATNGLFGDPIVNVVKRLVVSYTVDGKPQTKTVNENETLLLIGSASGPAEPLAYALSSDSNGRTVMTPWKAGSFEGKTAAGKNVSIVVKESPLQSDLSQGWVASFAPGLGAPPKVEFPKLKSWSDHSNSGVKYFSGSATYVKDFVVTPKMAASNRAARLDLGTVKNFATVRLNGKDLGTLWKEPFSLDVSGLLKTGRNRLEIKVTNLWPNRIIGDEQLPPDVEWNGAMLKAWPEWLAKGQPRPKTGRYTFATWRYWSKDSALLESGLIGPVVLRSAAKVVVK